LFDMDLRALRRDRAARVGPELFLLERAFADCLERIALVQRRFRRALLIGCPDRDWPRRLAAMVSEVEVVDPGSLFAKNASGAQIVEDEWPAPASAYDLVLAVGTLDTVNGLPLALRAIGHALQPDGLLIGALSGGDTLPQLRTAIRSVDHGAASPHVHPRIEAAALAPLLSAAGFVMPVVDVDRVQASYRSLPALVADLRAMGATNILAQRARTPIGRRSYAAACDAFADAGDEGRTVETFEILHFAAWTPAAEKHG
jgi:hypothetical protein